MTEMTETTKPTPLQTPIEESDPTWLCDRWEFAHKANDSSSWFKMGNICHCCAMAIWESNSTQRLEYLTLASLADQHGLNCEEEADIKRRRMTEQADARAEHGYRYRGL